VCITSYQPDTKSNPDPNPNPNPTTKQHAIVNIQLNIFTCPTYPDKFIQENVVAPFVRLKVVIVTLPLGNTFLRSENVVIVIVIALKNQTITYFANL